MNTLNFNLNLPDWALEALQIESARTDTSTNALVKHWIIERLDTITPALPR